MDLYGEATSGKNSFKAEHDEHVELKTIGLGEHTGDYGCEGRDPCPDRLLYPQTLSLEDSIHKLKMKLLWILYPSVYKRSQENFNVRMFSGLPDDCSILQGRNTAIKIF
ncbi:hypothetical protein EVAR_73836_1 [Eumeta japonica]|uniref:Uncharacterized protein n=1 Tax=Eumeta variegata TaxID=151549 RepID=A0A4C1T5J1_EUMVA|nr:hypothetical protein EVAR_73836_1 [Eumeta japonica]